MKRKKGLLIVSLSLLVCAACNSKGSLSYASLPIAGTNASLVLERECIHDYLAEYDRYLVLVIGQNPVARVQVTTDTGGMSSANVFLRESDSMLIVQDRMGRYEIDVKQKAIREVSNDCTNPQGSVFIGAFDNSESDGWRFIPATERKQMPMIISGCG